VGSVILTACRIAQLWFDVNAKPNKKPVSDVQEACCFVPVR